MRPFQPVLTKPLATSARPVSFVTRLVWLLVVGLLWWLATRGHAVSNLILPSPEEVIEAGHNIGWNLVDHLLATLLRTTVGVVLGGALGMTLGLLVQYSPWAQRVFVPFLDAARPVPVIALLPVFILLFGFSEIGRVLLIVISTAVFVSIATNEAIAKIPEQWVRFARISGASRLFIYRHIILPGCIPFLGGAFRLSLAIAFTLTIAAEFMGAQIGLGYLINTARVNLAIPTVWLAILILGLLCQALDLVLDYVFRDLTSWYRGTEE